MALRASFKAGGVQTRPRVAARTVRPVAALSKQQEKTVAAGVAGLAVAAAFAAAPVSAQQSLEEGLVAVRSGLWHALKGRDRQKTALLEEQGVC